MSRSRVARDGCFRFGGEWFGPFAVSQTTDGGRLCGFGGINCVRERVGHRGASGCRREVELLEVAQE
jgi:hypothetical protein